MQPQQTPQNQNNQSGPNPATGSQPSPFANRSRSFAKPQQPGALRQTANPATAGQPVISSSPYDFGASTPANDSGSRRKKMLIMAGILLGFVLVGLAVYGFIASQQPQTITLDKADKVTFNDPASVDDFEKTSTNSFTTLLATDTNCTLSYGVISQAELPGGNLNDVMVRYIDIVKENGASVEDPQTVAPLQLKGTDQKTTYLLPTSKIKYAQLSTGTAGLYSVVELPNKDHAVLHRVCTAIDKPQAEAALSSLNSAVSQITLDVVRQK